MHRPASYLELHRTGELRRRTDVLQETLSACDACPRGCGVDRHGALGECGVPSRPVIASWGPHFGEEPPISGHRGSGAVFLAGCNLRCRFCQNSDISQPQRPGGCEVASAEQLAEIMLLLQARGCHNVNWVSPTHQVAALLEGLCLAADRGLEIPIVYNSNAYDALHVLALLDGVVDIYMPDLKYADPDTARELSGVPDYPRHARAAIAEMFRQVGPAWHLDREDVLCRGLLVRILVLPNGLAGECDSLEWLADSLSPEVAVSLMSQYRPSHRACGPEAANGLDRRVTVAEYLRAVAALRSHNRSENTLVQPLPA